MAGRDAEIVKAARDLFLREGLSGVTMRRIAAEVGISAPAIYKHFADKDEVLRRVVDVGRERFASFLMRGLDGKTPKQRLILTGESYLDFAFEASADYQVMFMAWDKLRPGVHAPAPAAQPTALFQFLLDRVRECLPPRKAGSQEEVFELALLFWAHCHGLASLYLAGGGSALMPLPAYRDLSRREVRRLVEAVLD